MKPLLIHVHSFVDLITNSSSETFINVSDGSTKTIKKLVDGLLNMSGDCPLKCDDLFEIEIVHKYSTGDDYIWLTEEEAKAKFADGTLSEDDNEPDGYKYDECWGESSIRVTPKIKDDKHAAEIALILSNLEGLFNYDSTYNGWPMSCVIL